MPIDTTIPPADETPHNPNETILRIVLEDTLARMQAFEARLDAAAQTWSDRAIVDDWRRLHTGVCIAVGAAMATAGCRPAPFRCDHGVPITDSCLRCQRDGIADGLTRNLRRAHRVLGRAHV